MKNKHRLAKTPVINQGVPPPPEPAIERKPPEPAIVNRLPDPPYIAQDGPAMVPTISQAELLSYDNARLCFLTTRADFEQKRAALTLKLIQGCLPEPGDFIARLENDGEKLVVREHCQCCHSSVENFRQCEACHSWEE
jgi:hypothetical protein